MASVVDRPGGHKWIQFRGPVGKRQTIRLGVVTQAKAVQFAGRVDCLISSRLLGQGPTPDTAAWLRDLPDATFACLARCGLVTGRISLTVAGLVKEFLDGLSVEPSTRRNIGRVLENLTEYFGPDHPIGDLTEARARGFRAWLAGNAKKTRGAPGLSPATVSRRMRRARQVFNLAVNSGWLEANPFRNVSGGSEVNRSRDHFVTPESFAAIVDATPDLEFRAILALARYGGLRCPSEVLPLTWDCVDWGVGVLRVASQKNRLHESSAVRSVPMFPEVAEAVQALWDAAEKNEPFLFPRHQVKGTALRNQLGTACRRAGVTLWGKPFQNMRATREAELLEQFPIHVVATWLGHSPKVAIQHYAQIAKEHGARAVNLGKSVLHVSAGSEM